MRPLAKTNRRIGILALATASMTLPAIAGEKTNADGLTPFLVVERSALSEALVDPRDQALENAIAMIPQRLREIPLELPDQLDVNIPAEVMPMVDLALRTLSEPLRFSIVYNDDNPSAAFGYGIVLSIGAASQQDADTLHAFMQMGMQQNPEFQFEIEPSQQFEGMSMFMTPVTAVNFGPRKTDDGWRYEIIAGSVDDPDAGFGLLPQVDRGTNAFVRARLDLAGLNPAVNMAGMFGAPPEALNLIPMLQQIGVTGEKAMAFDLVIGHSETHTVSKLTAHNVKAFYDWARLSTETLDAEDFRAVPADAYTAGISKGDLEVLVGVIEKLREAGVPVDDALSQVEGMTGINIEEDLLKTIGGTMGFYTSVATGGGGAGSFVFFTSLKDRDRFEQTHDRFVAFANAMAQQIPTPGDYVGIQDWQHNGQTFYSIRFPGLPIPLELSATMTGDWFVMGLTPQAAIAGSRQIAGKGDLGLMGNPAFRAEIPRNQPFAGVGFRDVPKMLRQGYPAVSMLGSAVGNLVRSPLGDDREPGLIVPPYYELAEGARAQVQFAHWDGDDLIIESKSDRSVLVNLAGALSGGGSGFTQMIPFIMQGIQQAEQNSRRSGRRGGFDLGAPSPVSNLPFLGALPSRPTQPLP